MSQEVDAKQEKPELLPLIDYAYGGLCSFATPAWVVGIDHAPDYGAVGVSA